MRRISRITEDKHANKSRAEKVSLPPSLDRAARLKKAGQASLAKGMKGFLHPAWVLVNCVAFLAAIWVGMDAAAQERTWGSETPVPFLDGSGRPGTEQGTLVAQMPAGFQGSFLATEQSAAAPPGGVYGGRQAGAGEGASGFLASQMGLQPVPGSDNGTQETASGSPKVLESIPLAKKSEVREERRPSLSQNRPVLPWVTTLGALAVVIGVFLVFAWTVKRMNPQSGAVLPREVVEVLGQTSLSARQRLCLIRLGRKVILVAVSPDGLETLSEIDDPVEVDHLVGLCASQRNGSSTQAFKSLFSQYVNGQEKAL